MEKKAEEVKKEFDKLVKKIRGNLKYNFIGIFSDGKNVVVTTYGDIGNLPKIFTVAESDEGFNTIFSYLQRNMIKSSCKRESPYFTESGGSS
jgi:hypothetical protein